MDFPNSVWDEHRWEEHLKSLELGSVKRKSFVNNSWGDNEPVWIRFLKEYDDVEAALESFLDDELTYEEAYFPEDPDEDEEDDDIDDEIFLNSGDFFGDIDVETETDSDFPFSLGESSMPYIFDPAEEFYFDDYESINELDDELNELDYSELEEGDEWKAVLPEFQTDPYAEIDDPFYCYLHYDEIHEISLYFLHRTRIFPESQTSLSYLNFMHELLQGTTKYAAGLAFDHEEPTVIGAVITYFKKALSHINLAIDLLRVLKVEGLLNDREYLPLNTRIFELRNNLGIMIQEMREHLNKFTNK
ncbi:MAG: hypothetical protein GW823_07210 [Bacteroidetes bacterium]|nr:hypothetical protein [Bacteroidota bacterium]